MTCTAVTEAEDITQLFGIVDLLQETTAFCRREGIRSRKKH